jgi:ABC-type lipoprotein release transport system permease subunit
MRGRLRLTSRLITRDLNRRRGEAALLLLAIMTATTTLTLGLVLYGVTSNPYLRTRSATSGPDIVAAYQSFGQPASVTAARGLATLRALARASGVTRAGGPYPISWPTIRFGSISAGVIAEGRGTGTSAIDQPRLTQGSWVRPGGVVIERSFAAALGVRAGDRITLDGRGFRVAGIAVTAADVPYPSAEFMTFGGAFPTPECGLLWLTEADARSFASRSLPLSYVEELRLAHPSAADAFEAAHGGGPNGGPIGMNSWRDIERQDGNIIRNDQGALLFGASLLALLAIASVAVLVGGRMTEQNRRVGLLKAVGASPALIAVVLLAEHLLLAVVAAAAGIAAGWLVAPLLSNPGAGMLGAAGAPSLTWSVLGWVTLVAVAVALIASLVPAIRAARVSTVTALADAARSPRRRRVWIALSRRLPVPLLLGARIAARRPRRLVLAAASVTITMTTLVAVLTARARQDTVSVGADGLANPKFQSVDQVLLVLTVVMIALAAVNTVFLTSTTAMDARFSSALARSLGASSRQVIASLASVQLIPAIAGVLIGIPAGHAVVSAVRHGETLPSPPGGWVAVAAIGTVLVVTGLTTIAAALSTRRPMTEVLSSE